MTFISLKTNLANIPQDAPEAVVDQLFSGPLFQALGFEQNEIRREFSVGIRNEKVDYAARKNEIAGDEFLANPSNPYLLLELKGKNINLCPDSASYRSTVKQLKGYLLSPNCKTAQWGLITNSNYIQLFRRHGKVVHPVTDCINLNLENIDDVIELIKEKIHSPYKALTVAVYNNKGGVGKTTTVINLAATLTLLGKKVLIVDFDPNQQDLTHSLGLSLSDGQVFNCLSNKKLEIKSVVKEFSITNKSTGKKYSFEVIPADVKFAYEIDEHNIRNFLTTKRLHQVLEELKDIYDYILVDSPPNWRFFSQSAVYASDVVLIPTKHNNLFSLKNAAYAIKQFLPETQASRRDGGPIALPVFFNGEKSTEAQLNAARKEINNIITKVKRQDGFDLLPYFYPRYKKSINDQNQSRIFEVPSYAHIANAAFARIPAAYKDRSALDYYKALVKEYFL